MRKKRTTILVIAIIFLMAMALLVVFLMSRDTPGREEIVLPSPSPSGQAQGDETPDDETGGGAFAGITAETVKDVIALMSRPSSYYRTLYVTIGDGDSEKVEVWQRDGRTRTNITRGGTVRNVILAEGRLWIWYDKDSVYSGPAGEGFSPDDEQHIPSYENILASEKITDAAFFEASDVVTESCIYVELTPEKGVSELYWISFETGLLVRSEIVENGETVYLMTQESIEAPVTSEEAFGEAFSLPDGSPID